MKLPLGHSVSTPSLVYRLKKSLYGLRHASRQWYAKLSTSLYSKGYTHSQNDHSLFIKKSNESMVIVVVCVYDILVVGNDNEEIQSLKAFLDA